MVTDRTAFLDILDTLPSDEGAEWVKAELLALYDAQMARITTLEAELASVRAYLKRIGPAIDEDLEVLSERDLDAHVRRVQRLAAGRE